MMRNRWLCRSRTIEVIVMYWYMNLNGLAQMTIISRTVGTIMGPL